LLIWFLYTVFSSLFSFAPFNTTFTASIRTRTRRRRYDEVIRLAPNNPDPYQTLGMIYEELGNERKALDFLMIAAHLSPKDAQLWYRLAEMSNRQRNPRRGCASSTQLNAVECS
jgi:tetratricopeptide (TPR) repeat protein